MSSSIRFLTVVGLLAFTAVAVLWILGGKKEKCSTSILIDAPPAVVFPFLLEEEHQKRWMQDLEDIRPLGDEENILGARSHISFTDAEGKSSEYDLEIIRFEENELLSTRISNSTRAETSIFKLEAKDDNKTYLTYRLRTSNLGLGKLLGVFIETDDQKRIEEDSLRLKKLIESSVAESDPAPEEESSGETITSSN